MYKKLDENDVFIFLSKEKKDEGKWSLQYNKTVLNSKQKSSRKTSISVLLIMPKPLTVWITIYCGKF